ncbi:MAG TPA: hypothetical protein VMH01_09220 [Puia sp.]|nr:hypothetical protein [Puia sp.]
MKQILQIKATLDSNLNVDILGDKIDYQMYDRETKCICKRFHSYAFVIAPAFFPKICHFAQKAIILPD